MNISVLLKDATHLHLNGDLKNAEVAYKQILSINRRNFDATHRLAIIYAQTENHQLALEYFNKCLAINPISSEALANRAKLYIDSNNSDKALFDIDKALLLSKNNPMLFLMKGNAFKNLDLLNNAIDSYNEAINIDSSLYEAYCNRGVVFKELKQYKNALNDFTISISLNPLSIESYTNRGATYIDIKMYDQAFSDLNTALELNPVFIDALYNLASLFKYLKQFDKAVDLYKTVLQLNPNHIESVINLAVSLQELSHLDEAYLFFLRALEIEPEFRFNRSTFLSIKNKLCIWDNFDEEVNIAINEVNISSKIATPFHLLGLFDRPDLHLIATENYVAKECPLDLSLGIIEKHEINGRIRLAYYSADFHNHATSYLMAELFELHDKSKFELFAFSFGPKNMDEMYLRNIHIFDHFIDVTEMSDSEITILSRKLLIDIAVDLKGYTQFSRPNIFAKRCAPIQVNYLGYPGTLGAEYIDFILADKIVIPENNQYLYTEKVLYLPDCYQVNDSKRSISQRVFSKREVGLPDEGIVFCCFNNCYKILPTIFDVWMDVLNCVKNSVLWLLDDNPTATSNLMIEANKRGIDNQRLVFAKRLKLDEHLARHKLADLFLDTLPYNAHTTASDALWAGLPVLTCSGQSFASRVGASLLHSLELTELITHSLEEYKSMAINLGNNPSKIESLKYKLSLNINSKPLFNSKKFAKDFENILSKIVEYD
jgi:predicted O-linked N-acetylglucosamine transferase (SPINDLY family)